MLASIRDRSARQPPGPPKRLALASCNASLAFAFTGCSGRRGLVLHDLRLGLVRGLLRQAEVSVRAFLDRLHHCTGRLRLRSDDRELREQGEFTGACGLAPCVLRFIKCALVSITGRSVATTATELLTRTRSTLCEWLVPWARLARLPRSSAVFRLSRDGPRAAAASGKGTAPSEKGRPAYRSCSKVARLAGGVTPRNSKRGVAGEGRGNSTAPAATGAAAGH
jgi:hypothetical protein